MANIEALVLFKEPQKKAEAAELVAEFGGVMEEGDYIIHKESIKDGKPEDFLAYGSIIKIPPERVEEISKHPATYGIYTKSIAEEVRVPRESPYFDPQWMWNERLQGWAIICHNHRAELAEYEKVKKALDEICHS
jgi:hypothetical protein